MTENKLIQMTDILAIILLGILALFLISPALIDSNTILGPADSLNQWQPYQSVNPANGTPQKNYLLADQILQFIPWKIYTQHWMSQGIVPLWNHHQYTGAPFLGNSQSSIFYPINLLTLFFNIHWNLLLSAFLKLWIAGMGMYLFLRKIKLESSSSFFGGLAFMFSGFNILWLGHPHTNVYIWLPWLLLATENLFNHSTQRNLGFLGLVIGFSLLGGHPETEFLVLLVWGIYSLYRLFISNSEDTKSNQILYLLGALLLGLAIASIQWLPSMEYILNSSAYQQRLTGIPSQDYQAKRAILTWLFPNLFGNPVTNNFWVKDELFYQFNYNEAVSNYIGVISILLAGVGFLYRDKWPYSRFFIGLGLFAAVITYRVPILGPALAKIPPISLIHPKRIIIIMSFALIVLAAQGMNTLLNPSMKKEESKPLRLWAYVFWIIGIFLALIGLNHHNFSLLLVKKGFQSISQYPLQAYGPIVIEALRWGNLFLILSLIAISITIFTAWNRQVKAFLILVVLGADLISFGWNYNPVVPAKYLFPDNPVATELKKDTTQYRIISLDEWTVYPPNTAMMDGLEDVRGYDAVVPARYEQFFRTSGLGFWKDPDPRIWQKDTTGEERALRVLNFLNVKYLLSARAIPLSQKLELVKQWPELFLYQNPGVQSRIFICRNIERLGDSNYILGRLQDPQFNLQDKLLVEGYNPPLAIDSEYSGETVSLTYPNPNEMVVNVKMDKSGMVCIAENYDPGWSGILNGKLITPIHAQYAFMAFALPAGNYQLTLNYRPTLFYLGFIFALIGLLEVLWLIFHNEKITISPE